MARNQRIGTSVITALITSIILRTLPKAKNGSVSVNRATSRTGKPIPIRELQVT